MPRFIKNLAASVKTRLLKYAENNNKTFDSILLAFGHERLIARLSLSTHRENYVLKGGVLIMRWLVDIGRETSDIDFATIGEQTADKVTSEFMEIMGIDANDGLSFNVSEVKTQPLGEKNTFEGIRLKTTAYLESTRIPIVLDFNLTDSYYDKVFEFDFESLLDFPSSRVLAYSPEYILSEKFHAIVTQKLENSRMKDYFDLYALRRKVKISNAEMKQALLTTFLRRGTEIPQIRPIGLSSQYSQDPSRIDSWRRYAEKTNLADTSLEHVAIDIWEWLHPFCREILNSTSTHDHL